MSWWVWLIIMIVLASASAFCAMLSLSAGTAFGTNYHTLSPAQRVMGRGLYLGALAVAVLCALAALVAALLAIKPLIG